MLCRRPMLCVADRCCVSQTFAVNAWPTAPSPAAPNHLLLSQFQRETKITCFSDYRPVTPTPVPKKTFEHLKHDSVLHVTSIERCLGHVSMSSRRKQACGFQLSDQKCCLRSTAEQPKQRLKKKIKLKCSAVLHIRLISWQTGKN